MNEFTSHLPKAREFPSLHANNFNPSSGSGYQELALYPGLLAPAFVTCGSTASDKHWGEKAWVRG